VALAGVERHSREAQASEGGTYAQHKQARVSLLGSFGVTDIELDVQHVQHQLLGI
jgi:hypothetical protein